MTLKYSTCRSLIFAIFAIVASFALVFVVIGSKSAGTPRFEVGHQEPPRVKEFSSYSPDVAGNSNREALFSETFRFENGLVTITESRYNLSPHHIGKLNAADLEILYEKVVLEATADCSTSRRIGRREDGGWDLCLVGPLVPQPPCFGFSFGINDVWEYDDELSADFKCNVLAFDPSMQSKSHVRSSRLWFLKEGLREAKGTFNSWSVDSYLGYLKRFKAENFVVDVLKIDIEHSEWPSLETALRDGSLMNVKQLLLETHVRPMESVTQYVRYLTILRELYKLGFRQWHHNWNNYGNFMSQLHANQLRTCCHELYYININFLRGVPGGRSFRNPPGSAFSFNSTTFAESAKA